MRLPAKVRLLQLRLLTIILTFVVGLSVWGCQSGSHEEAPEETALVDSLAEGYEWLKDQYAQMGTPMPSPMQGMRGRMQAMHGRMMARKDSMMNGHGGGEMMGRMQGRMGRGGMMGRGGNSGEDTAVDSPRMGHGDMSAMHETMARMHAERQGRMAARHWKMAQWHEQMMGESAALQSGVSGENPQIPDDAVRDGATLFDRQCASCHGQNGQGISGTFPPLTDSEWVIGDVSVLARIVIHGLEGPIEVEGRRYDGVMPAFGSRLSDPELAELLTYVRTSINENEGTVEANEIADIRENHADRRRAWTANVLKSDTTRPSTSGDGN